MSTRTGSRSLVGVVIPAGGAGTRMGGTLPKQFLRLRGSPILLRTLRVFDSHPAVDEIVVAGPAAHLRRIRRMVAHAGLAKVRGIVEGGATRQESAALGVAVLGAGVGIVLVHDAVRPLVDPQLIDGVIEAARRWGAAAAAVRSRETIHWEGARGFFTSTMDRARAWSVQTPQGFRRKLIETAYERAAGAGFSGTDEAALVLRLGRRVRIVESSPRNLKITDPGDLRIAAAWVTPLHPRK